MEPTVKEMIDQLQELPDSLAKRKNEILKLPASEFIRSFVELTTAIEQLDSLREILLGRAEKLLSKPEETERQLRREHLKLVYNRK